MLFAFVYSVVRLLLDVLDVRLRVRNPEAELLLLRVVRTKSGDGRWDRDLGIGEDLARDQG